MCNDCGSVFMRNICGSDFMRNHAVHRVLCITSFRKTTQNVTHQRLASYVCLISVAMALSTTTRTS